MISALIGYTDVCRGLDVCVYIVSYGRGHIIKGYFRYKQKTVFGMKTALKLNLYRAT